MQALLDDRHWKGRGERAAIFRRAAQLLEQHRNELAGWIVRESGGLRAFDEDIVGPVASVTPFASDDEAVALAKRTEYGLAAAVMSRSTSRALAIGKRLKVGLLHINDQTVAGDPHVPCGGRGASGNGSRIGGPANWDGFTQWRWITVRDAPPPYPF